MLNRKAIQYYRTTRSHILQECVAIEIPSETVTSQCTQSVPVRKNEQSVRIMNTRNIYCK
jgi:hypothetical protein